MEINVSQEKGRVPVSVVHIKGDLDASSYLDLVNTAQKLYNVGVRSLLPIYPIWSSSVALGWPPCILSPRYSAAKKLSSKIVGALTRKSNVSAKAASRSISSCLTHPLMWIKC